MGWSRYIGGRQLGRIVATALLLASLGGCEQIEELLGQAAGEPQQNTTTGEAGQASVYIPPGDYLYCITNIGATMVAYDLTTEQVRADSRRKLYPDPVGPWFVGQRGFYISRVAGDGSGKNALVGFNPVTLDEVARLNFPPNSNPTTMLVLPGGDTAYVALRGSTFDNFATNGVSVVNLATLTQAGYLNLNDTGVYPAGHGGGALTSLNGLTWDAACNGGACVYAVANNWKNVVRQGWLLLLRPGTNDIPTIADVMALGDSPEGHLLFDAGGALWVVNNGGYGEFGGGPGSLQVLDPAKFDDGTPDNETLATLDQGSDTSFPADPTGLYAFDGTIAWLTTYPEDVVRTVDLAGRSLQALDPNLPRVTGPLFHPQQPAAAVYGGLGGFGTARLGRLNPSSQALLSDQSLLSGGGTVSCAEHTLN